MIYRILKTFIVFFILFMTEPSCTSAQRGYRNGYGGGGGGYGSNGYGYGGNYYGEGYGGYGDMYGNGEYLDYYGVGSGYGGQYGQSGYGQSYNQCIRNCQLRRSRNCYNLCRSYG